MSKVTVLRGYSGSGKSTWASKQGALVVSRDAIRAQITGSPVKTVLDAAGEALVTKLEAAQIVTAIKAGVNVVVDNTNLRAKFARRYLDLAVKHGAEWEVVDFPTPVEVCLERNELRPNGVPSKVIEDQAKRFPIASWPVLIPSAAPLPQWEPYIPDPSLPPAVLFDLDGTLALHTSGRSPYDTSRYMEDTVDPAVKEHLDMVDRSGYFVLIVTGRDEAFRDVCQRWLRDNGVGYDELFMRPEGDTRNDAIVKSELLDQIGQKYRVAWAVDDRDRVVDMYRARSVKVFQAERGDF